MKLFFWVEDSSSAPVHGLDVLDGVCWKSSVKHENALYCRHYRYKAQWQYKTPADLIPKPDLSKMKMISEGTTPPSFSTSKTEIPNGLPLGTFSEKVIV